MRPQLAMMLISILAEEVNAATEQSLEALPEAGRPYMVPLRRESVPIKRYGKIASFKTTYSGLVSVGSPMRQEFRVVFDTGSGHVVLPSADCGSETCLLHRRYDMAHSHTATLINADGTLVEEGDYADQATIGYGTGQVTGEFVQDNLCLGPNERPEDVSEEEWNQRPCTDVAIVSAIEMSQQPFRSFKFDGIVGLGLSSLAVTPSFSFFGILSGQQGFSPRFGFFLAEDEDKEEESELALGGYNPKRLLEPLAWTSVAKAELGHWQVPIIAVRIDGKVLDMCVDGTCRGIVDTGSSHLGVPKLHTKEVTEMLTQEAVDILDCRLALAPTVEIELPGINITVPPMTYMRRLPLREGVSVSSGKGVTMHPAPGQAAPSTAEADQMSVLNVNVTMIEGAEKNSSNASTSVNRSQTTGNTTSLPALRSTKRFCRPKMMPVDLPAPLGPKLFILGEPVLHRYYTVYDWSVPRIGWGLAATHQNMADPADIVDRRGSLPDGVDSVLLQKHVHMDLYQAGSAAETDDFALTQADAWAETDDFALTQAGVPAVTRVMRRRCLPSRY